MKKILILLAVLLVLILGILILGGNGKKDQETTTTEKVLAEWRSLPLVDGTDWKTIESQISINAKDWNAAVSFIKKTDLGTLPLGRVDIADSGCFANVQEYQTKPDADFEAHRDYVDVQIVVWGEETIYMAPLSGLSSESVPYSKEKDIVYYKDAAGVTSMKADPSHYAVFFPSDGHKPSIHWQSTPSDVRKVVVKIPVK